MFEKYIHSRRTVFEKVFDLATFIVIVFTVAVLISFDALSIGDVVMGVVNSIAYISAYAGILAIPVFIAIFALGCVSIAYKVVRYTKRQHPRQRWLIGWDIVVSLPYLLMLWFMLSLFV